MRLALPYYWTLRTEVGRHPRLFGMLYRLFDGDRARLVSSQSELVIEGFPRSGNSFSVNAFGWAQAREVRIANHIHIPGQITAGLALKKPVCLLIRPPDEVIPALLAKIPHFSAADAGKAYERYYRALAPYRHDIVVASFAQVTADFGQVIERINEKFGCSYKTIDQATHEEFSRRFLALDKLQRATLKASYLSVEERAAVAAGDHKDNLAIPNLAACEAVYREFSP